MLCQFAISAIVNMLELVQRGPPDPMFVLKTSADADTSREKVDLGVGIYRNEAGRYQELEAVKQVELLS